jgi:hypothetical protein
MGQQFEYHSASNRDSPAPIGGVGAVVFFALAICPATDALYIKLYRLSGGLPALVELGYTAIAALILGTIAIFLLAQTLRQRNFKRELYYPVLLLLTVYVMEMIAFIAAPGASLGNPH